ncbi:MAG: CsbD family protein [Proteobacteria bacterium]|nr:CsbD family protein [Pseudomonadota bacterium]
MNRDRIAGNWKQAKGKAKEQWGRITDDSFVVIAGKRDQLAGMVQAKRGAARDAAEHQYKEWETRYERLFKAHPKI